MDLYRGRLLRYEHLIGELGLRNSKLYYNLGNAYYQLDRHCRAIVNYRRAERLDPRGCEPAAQSGAALALSARTGSIPDTGGQALRTLLFWHFEFSASTRCTDLRRRLVSCSWSLLLLRSLGLGVGAAGDRRRGGIAALLVLAP